MRTPKPISERRRAIRIEESLPFKIGHDGFEVEVRTLNISFNGAMCLIDRDIPLMTKLKVALTLPKTHSRSKESVVRAQGVVVRKAPDPLSDKFHIAIFFSEIRSEDQKQLQAFIDQRLSA